MGELRLVREQRDNRQLLFAVRQSGETVWAVDPASGQEWWYVTAGIDELRPQIRAALAEAPQPEPSAPVCPASAVTQTAAQPPATAQSQRGDLAANPPGHALLVQIEHLHAQAVHASDGTSGVLDPGITPWCVGYVGEERAAAVLRRLPAPWRVLHSVPVGTRGSDIDHVLIGPPGLVTINTKHHPGVRVDVKGDAVFVGRDHEFYVRNARTEAARAAATLKTTRITAPTYPVLCTVGARLTIREPPVGVTAITVEHLVPWLLSLPIQLAGDQIEAAYAHLRMSASWTTVPLAPPAAPWVAEFARSMSHEHAVSKQQRRGRSATRGPSVYGAAPSAKRPDTSRRTRKPANPPRRRPKTALRRRRVSSRLELLRGAMVLAALIALWVVAPQALRALAPSTPAPSPTHATAGQVCQTKGERSTDAKGKALVCAPDAKKALHWQLTK